jgi:hypothetical protein
MNEAARFVLMAKRATKMKRLEGASPPSRTTTEENKERTDQRLGRLGLFILTYHLQKFVENRALQALFKEHDLVISWDDEKKKVGVVTRPKRPAESEKR